ncbi:hypothetical protein [Sphingomicrobium astaxanthinifaciens]|uniref:hypothetical protein n=1 Tax=Sphingomicrobium astaxanthinifaciens TaxID=1227949 RepID=UPI001FCB4CC0|nr:hypothetical protein [Sphingomicrobium astaxanthinifaciens]MCJ7421910.1 hypothetical protein [Sphingomicrobium astaxanthinifaciens]
MLLALAALVLAQPTDHRARLLDNGELALTIDIDAEGTVVARAPEDGEHVFVKDGRHYRWREEEDRTTLVDVALLNAIMAEEAGSWFEAMAGDIELPTVEMVEIGPATVGRFEGIAYRIEGALDADEIVLSTDPALAPLGRAMRESLLLSVTTSPFPGIVDAYAPLIALLETGTVLRKEGLELASFESIDLPDEHFAFPATPLTREETRGWMADQRLIRSPDER